ncbi:MAG TPA: tRNA (adenosine(37)-N6)-dimethylallyltransferase MiaA [Deltaproteobacteria bacterium]|nr:tRNA (adenosine(37)-N6)-dimethylallyltransferase MiaA [Deltaproteobacteria bacterium]
MAKNLVVILGPTASGKTAMAAKLAFDLRGEIISADSRQVYKGMDIGTGKDLNQYTVRGEKIKYHLIDVIAPQEEFSLYDFQTKFYQIFSDLAGKKILPIMVGGTGLYLESVLAAYDLPPAPADEQLREKLSGKTKSELQEILLSLKPRVHNITDMEDTRRLVRAIEIERARKGTFRLKEKPEIDAAVFGIKWDRAVLRRRITGRLEERMNQGMIEEVETLHKEGLSWERLESFGLEYRLAALYLQNKLSYREMTQSLNTGIHQFAKRQETWFRRMEKRGTIIHWIEGDNYTLLKESVLKYLK